MLFIIPEIVEQVCVCYIQGMSEEEMEDVLGLSSNEIRDILDIYTQYL